MEDTLREINKDILDRFNVLILVLMEDTLRVKMYQLVMASSLVLILVLMEDTLRVT